MNQPPAGRARPSASTIIAAGIILILAVVTLVGAVTVFQLPDPVTEQAKRTDLLYQPVLAISFVIFFAVTAAIIWAMFRYRRKSNDEMPAQIHGSTTIEIGGVIASIVILIPLFIWSLILILDFKDPPSDDEVDVTVEAVGHQWWWEFIYPDDGVRVQQTPPNYADLTPPALVVPVNKVVRVVVRSTDVVHSFSAPRTLYKIQAIPGNVNEMHFKAEKTGSFHGQCYQFCGLRHSDMLFTLDVRSEADYQSWLRETRRAQGVSAPSDRASVTDATDTKSE